MKINLLNEFKILLKSSQLLNNNIIYKNIVQENLSIYE